MLHSQIKNYITDGCIFLFSLLYFLDITRTDESQLSSVNSIILVILILMIDLFVPPYLAGLTDRIIKSYTQRLFWLKYFFFGYLILSMATLSFVLPIVLFIEKYLNAIEFGILLITGMVMVILSLANRGDQGTDSGKKDNQAVFILLIAILIPITLVGLVYAIYYFANGEIIDGLVTFLGMIIGIIFFTALFVKIEEYKSHPFVILYFYPALSTVSVLIWQELFYHLAIERNLSMNGAGMVLYTASGVLLFRILVLFEPPVHFLNVILGILSVSGFIAIRFIH